MERKEIILGRKWEEYQKIETEGERESERERERERETERERELIVGVPLMKPSLDRSWTKKIEQW